MKNYKNGFTLIEVIVATSILTLTVFGVYKLIGENNKLLSQSQNIQNSHFLYYPFVECLENIGLSSLQSEANTVYIGFGSDNLGCEIVSDSYVISIDNIDYQLKAEKIDSGSDYIDWNLEIISDGGKSIQNNFLQK